jgi:hypothetical protein
MLNYQKKLTGEYYGNYDAVAVKCMESASGCKGGEKV